MAKAKKGTRVKRAKKTPKRRSMRVNPPNRPQRQVMVAPIEKAVRDYISLLKDPCNGPLVGPVGATANGYITRFETTVVVNPANPTWVLRWAPGALSFTVATANSEGLYAAESATIGGVLTQGLSNNAAPGYSFLDSTCQTFRCLAACAQIRYTDTEVNRKGVLGSTICSSARVIPTSGDAFSITVDRARVPDQGLEVLWQPADGDEDFTTRQTAVHSDEFRGRKNAILLSGQNCLAASVSVRLVVVYQWTPGSNDSIILPIPTPGTGVTMARVVQLARQTGFVAGHLLKGYATGGLYGVAREAASMIKPSTLSMR